MTTLWTKIVAFTKTHAFLLIGLIVGMVLFFAAYGCESTVPSILSTTLPAISGGTATKKMVTRNELSAELTYIAAVAETRYADLDKQDQIRAMLLSQASLIASGGTFNPVGLLPILAGIMGIGAVVDNRKNASVINSQQMQISSLKSVIEKNTA
jgi:hypothetical protein